MPKTPSLLFALMLPVFGFADNEKKLNESLAAWEKAKVSCKGNYSYKVTFSSFSGFSTKTELTAKANKIVERRYTEQNMMQLQPGPKKHGGPKWIEKGKDLGTHREGAPVKTLDELYAEARNVVSRKLPAHEKLYLRFDKAGLLNSCFTVDTRIADDAPTKGVRIASIQLAAAAGGGVHKAPNGKVFPAHWGAPPLIQTRDLRPLPGGYGSGSGTLVKWIQGHLDKDAKAQKD